MMLSDSLYIWACLAEIMIAVIVFILLFFISAPYGRHAKSTWGPMISAKIGWFAMEFPAAVAHFYWFLKRDSSLGLPCTLFCLLFEIHYLNRSLLFPFLMSKASKPMPIVVGLMALSFNLLNGFVNGYGVYCSSYAAQYASSDYFHQANFIVGAVLFVLGLYINIWSDQILRDIKREGENDYKVPYGGFHDYVASPNYFGEIVEWCGWAVMTWSLGGLTFAIFTVANLVPRAITHRRWYAEKFKEQYPVSRKAVIPFLI
jgi:protein-S-isoprenylcysteine O-methyltransferase Ste14